MNYLPSNYLVMYKDKEYIAHLQPNNHYYIHISDNEYINLHTSWIQEIDDKKAFVDPILNKIVCFIK